MQPAAHHHIGKARLRLVKTGCPAPPELPTLLSFLFYLEGYSCAEADDDVDSNPYNRGTIEQIAWQNGWQEYWRSH